MGEIFDKNNLLTQFNNLPNDVDLNDIPSLSTTIISLEINNLFSSIKLAIQDICESSDVDNSLSVSGKRSDVCIALSCVSGFNQVAGICVKKEPILVSNTREDISLDDVVSANNIFILNNTLYFRADNIDNKNRMYRIDQNTQTPVLLAPTVNDTTKRQSPERFVVAGNNLIFAADKDSGEDWFMYKSDDTLVNISTDPFGFINKTGPNINFNGTAIVQFDPRGINNFNGNNTLGRAMIKIESNGQASYLAKTNPSGLDNVSSSNGTFDSSETHFLFNSYDGNKRYTYSIDQNGNLSRFTEDENRNSKICGNHAVYLSDNASGVNNKRRIWRADLVTGSFSVMRDLRSDSTTASNTIRTPVRVGDSCVTSILEYDTAKAVTVYKIVRIDRSGDFVILDENTDGFFIESSPMIVKDNFFYYRKRDIDGNSKLWRVDTTNGTKKKYEFYPGVGENISIFQDDLIDDRLYFTLGPNTGNFLDTYMIDIDNEVNLIADINPNNSDSSREFTKHNGYIYFVAGVSADDGQGELHRMNLDGSNIEQVYNINPGLNDNISGLNSVNGQLYFIFQNRSIPTNARKIFRLDDITNSEINN